MPRKKQLKNIVIMFLCCFSLLSSANNSPYETATFAGGCFWCMEPPFDKIPGVISTISGFTGGHTENPNYQQVSTGQTGHAEAVQVIYDPNEVNYQTLLSTFWVNIDPTISNGQFCDQGSQYRSAIFFHNDNQKKLAEVSLVKLQQSGRFNTSIKTQIVPASQFYPAEELHQNYYKKNYFTYQFYRTLCGRDKRLKFLWGSSFLD